MYWPLGTPRIYATSCSRQPGVLRIVSNDGLPSPLPSPAPAPAPEQRPDRNSLLSPSSAAVRDGLDTSSSAAAPLTPVTPITPLTPGIKPVEHGHDGIDDHSPAFSQASATPSIPLHEPILALRVSRAGHVFAVVTATSITLWQTKVGAAPAWKLGLRAVNVSNWMPSPPSSLPLLSVPTRLSSPMARTPTCSYVQTPPSSSSIRAWDI
jgi:hypothetical protein